MNGDAKICFIGYGKLSELARRVLARPEYTKEPIMLVDTMVDNLHNIVEEATQQGCEVFIAGSANAAEFRRFSGSMLIELKIRPLDYALAIRKACKLGSRPVVACYRYSRVIRQAEIEVLFDADISYLEYQTSEELIEKLAASGADVVIGASHAVEAAEQLGKASVYVYPGEDTIVEAVRRACSVINMLKKERRNSEFLRTIIAESKTGIVGFSERREVLIINAAARELTGLSTGEARRTGLRQILSDEEFIRLLDKETKSSALVKKIGNQHVRIQCADMDDGGRRLGTVLLLERIDEADADDPHESRFSQGLSTFRDAVALSRRMKKTVADAKLYGGRAGSPLVITGEHGTGKQMLAQSIHNFYRAENGAYVTLNCAAVRDTETVELLFGHTGTPEQPPARAPIDLGGVGTLVLENLWEAGERLQACLLWVLDGRTDCVYSDRGGRLLQTEVITLIPADRWELCEKNVRADLLQRLRAFVLVVPPLRERQEDIPSLFFRYLNGGTDCNRPTFGKDHLLLPVLQGYSWPGNGNELRNVCQRYALETAAGGKLTPTGKKRLLIECIGEETLFADLVRQAGVPADAEQMTGEQLVELSEKLKAVLLYNNGQIAEKLGISRTSMWRRMRETDAE